MKYASVGDDESFVPKYGTKLSFSYEYFYLQDKKLILYLIFCNNHRGMHQGMHHAYWSCRNYHSCPESDKQEYH